MTQQSIPELARFEHILSHRVGYKRINVAALTIYVDDSGTSPQEDVAIAAGWIAPAGNWLRFIKEWSKYAREEGFTAFHMAAAVSRDKKSIFAGWSEKRVERVAHKLRYLTRATAVRGFAFAIKKLDYDDLVTGELRKDAGEHHYTFAIRNLVGRMESWREENGIREPTEYIFDRETKGPRKKEIESVFEQAENEDNCLHRYGIYKGGHSFRDKEVVTPLQGADIFAWCAYQRFVTDRPVKKIAKETFNYFNEHKNGKVEVLYQTREKLAEWVSGIRPKDSFWGVRVIR